MAEGRTAFPTDPDGWYVEGVECTSFLLERETFPGSSIWDPACGGGNVIRACQAAGLTAVGSDIHDRVSVRRRSGLETPGWFIGRQDFLTHPHVPSWRHSIITNPPYGGAKLAEAFIRRVLEEMPWVDKSAFFVNSKFLFSDGRSTGLFFDHPPARIYPVTPRPSCPPGRFLRRGGKAAGGVQDFVWLVYSRDAVGAPTEFIWKPPLGAPFRHGMTLPDCGDE